MPRETKSTTPRLEMLCTGGKLSRIKDDHAQANDQLKPNNDMGSGEHDAAD